MSDFKKSYDFANGEVLLFDKDLDWTSFDLVNRVRNGLYKLTGIKKLKVGHAGTLDPLATGLLILCTGKATKQIETYQAAEKEYMATIKLGATTPSFDMETEEDSQNDCSYVTEDSFKTVLKKFVGEIDQVPPIFSAIKVKGKRAFDYIRGYNGGVGYSKYFFIATGLGFFLQNGIYFFSRCISIGYKSNVRQRTYRNRSANGDAIKFSF